MGITIEGGIVVIAFVIGALAFLSGVTGHLLFPGKDYLPPIPDQTTKLILVLFGLPVMGLAIWMAIPQPPPALIVPTLAPPPTAVPTPVPTPMPTPDLPQTLVPTSAPIPGIDMTDTDGDGLWDITERDIGTSPLAPDTDFDGVSDFDEWLRIQLPTAVPTSRFEIGA